MLADVIRIGNADIIVRADMLMFSKRPIEQDDGSFKIVDPPLSLRSQIKLNAGDIPNLKKNATVTVGQVIFNNLCILQPFGPDIFPFPTKPVNNAKFTDEITDKLKLGEVTPKQKAQFLNAVVWLTEFASIILPGISEKLLVTPKEVKTMRKQLEVEHPNATGVEFVDKIEKPLLKELTRVLKDDPSYILYELGKPSVGNHLKQTISTFSPIYNIVTGKYETPKGNLMEGISAKDFHLFANMNISGTFDRAVGTQDGGAIVKSIYGSMHAIVCDDEGTDCGSTRGKQVVVTADDVKGYFYNYYIVAGTNKTVLISDSNKEKLIGKTIQVRSPLFCDSKDPSKICNKCIGEIPYMLKYRMIGNLTSRVGFNMVNASLKSFHDSTIKTVRVDPFDYME